MSTMFLKGPCKQFKSMFDSTRIIATIVFLVVLIATLVVAIAVRHGAGWCCVVCSDTRLSRAAIPIVRHTPWRHRHVRRPQSRTDDCGVVFYVVCW